MNSCPGTLRQLLVEQVAEGKQRGLEDDAVGKKLGYNYNNYGTCIRRLVKLHVHVLT